MRFFVLLPFLLLLPWLVDLATRAKHLEHVPTKSVVLVTGASRGVGLALTLQLASKGVLVIAGMRSATDFKVVAGNSNIQPILLDVSSQAHIHEAANVVSSVLRTSGRSFAGVVANAGLQFPAPCEYETEEHEHKVFNVNYFGAVRLIRGLLPLLVAEQGRVIIVGSIGVTMTMPFLSSYQATKAALLSYSNVLRSEVEHQGVAVVYVHLGGVKTDMLSGSSGESFNGTAYAELSAKVQRMTQQAKSLMATAQQVAPEMSDLVFTPYPPCSAYVGLDAKITRIFGLLPQRLLHALL